MDLTLHQLWERMRKGDIPSKYFTAVLGYQPAKLYVFAKTYPRTTGCIVELGDPFPIVHTDHSTLFREIEFHYVSFNKTGVVDG